MVRKLEISPESLIALIQQKMSVKLAIRKTEHKHFLYAQLLAYSILLESKKFTNSDLDSILAGLIAILTKEPRFWNPVKQLFKKLDKDHLPQLERAVKNLDQGNLQTALMLLIWKKKKSFEPVLKTQFSAKNCLTSFINQAVESFPQEDYAFKAFLKFQEKQGDVDVYNQMFEQVPAEGLKHFFVKLLIIKSYVKSEKFQWSLPEAWNVFWQRNLNGSNKLLQNLAIKISKKLI